MHLVKILLLASLIVSTFGFRLRQSEAGGENFCDNRCLRTQHPGCEWSRRRRMGIGIWTTKRGRKQSIQEICSSCPDPASCLPATGRPWRIWARQGPIFYPIFFDRLFLIRAYWNPKSRQGPNLACLPCRGVAALKMTWIMNTPHTSKSQDIKKLDLIMWFFP